MGPLAAGGDVEGVGTTASNASDRRGCWIVESRENDGEPCIRLLYARWLPIYWHIGGQIALISDMPIWVGSACRSRAICLSFFLPFLTRLFIAQKTCPEVLEVWHHSTLQGTQTIQSLTIEHRELAYQAYLQELFVHTGTHPLFFYDVYYRELTRLPLSAYQTEAYAYVHEKESESAFLRRQKARVVQQGNYRRPEYSPRTSSLSRSGEFLLKSRRRVFHKFQCTAADNPQSGRHILDCYYIRQYVTPLSCS